MSVESQKFYTAEECAFENKNKQRALREFVKETYEKSDQPKDKIESFIQHNETILKYAEELAQAEQLDAHDTRILKLAAELHDVSKFDVPLVKHGFEGAKAARSKLKEVGFEKEVMEKIANAIERHMGPIPGFMAEQAKKWEQKTGEKIEFPRPENEIDKCLYDADMLSLIDKQGIKKILTIRASEKWAVEEDKKIAQAENISQEKAAWLSALKSAKQAADSLFTESAKNEAKELLEKAQKAFEESLTDINSSK
jgi:hypothetical protein